MTTSGPSDDDYTEMVREILFAEPIRGVPANPCRLLDHVYIGSQSNAESLKLLRSLNITHVLNCAGYKGPRPFPNASPYEGLGIDYYEFQAEDTDRYDICQHFPEAFPFLDRVKRDGGVALVHCALGINRSGAVCLGYIMSHCRMPLLKATQLLKDRRRVVLANKYFHRLLVRYARSRGLLDHVMNGSSADNTILGLTNYSKNGAQLRRGWHSNGLVGSDFKSEDSRSYHTNTGKDSYSNGLGIYNKDNYTNGLGIYNGNGYSTGYCNGYFGANGYVSNSLGSSSGLGSSSNSRLNGLCRDLYSRFDRLAESLKSAAAVTKSPPIREAGSDYLSTRSSDVVYRARSQSALPNNRRSATPSLGEGRYNWSLGSASEGLTRHGSLRGLTDVGIGSRSSLGNSRRRPVSYVHAPSNYY